MLPTITVPEWVEDALCARVDLDLFFPEPGGSVTGPKEICAQCPVQQECLDYAISNGERYGIWGGMTPEERKAKHGIAAPKDCQVCGQVFQTKTTSKYCTDECRVVSKRRRQAKSYAQSVRSVA